MEDTLDGLKTYFDDNFETELVLVETERSVDITRLTAIEVVQIIDAQRPFMELVADFIDYDYGELDSNLLDPTEEHQVLCNVEASGSDRRAVQQQLFRYAEVVRRLLVKDPSLGDQTKYAGTRMGRFDFTEATQEEDDRSAIHRVSMELVVTRIR